MNTARASKTLNSSSSSSSLRAFVLNRRDEHLDPRGSTIATELLLRPRRSLATMPTMAPKFVRANVRNMDGYTPGEQPGPGERVVKLNTNENPFPPSPRVLQTIREIEPEMLRRYPNPSAAGFRESAAKVLGITADMILAGNGSDDILTIATRTFLSPGDTLAYPDPTYSLYNVLAKLQDAKIAEILWERDYSLPIEGLLATKPQAIYIANPNAPTGTFVSPLK